MTRHRHVKGQAVIDWNDVCVLCASPRWSRSLVHAVEGDRVGAATRKPLRPGVAHVCGPCVHWGRDPGRPWDALPSSNASGLLYYLPRAAEAVALARRCRGALHDGFLVDVLRSPRMVSSSDRAVSLKTTALAETAVAQDLRCAYCLDPLVPDEATVDHDVPTVRGGTNEPYNLVWACKYCNTLKSFLTGSEYRAMLADPDPPRVPAALHRQARYRCNLGLPTDCLDAAWAKPTEGRPKNVDEAERFAPWTVGEPVTQWDWTESRGRFVKATGLVVEPPPKRSAKGDLAWVASDGRTFRVYVATWRERGLPFEETLDNFRRWIPDRISTSFSDDAFVDVMTSREKADYLRSFLVVSTPQAPCQAGGGESLTPRRTLE